jgi:hypothetical protein
MVCGGCGGCGGGCGNDGKRTIKMYLRIYIPAAKLQLCFATWSSGIAVRMTSISSSTQTARHCTFNST